MSETREMTRLLYPIDEAATQLGCGRTTVYSLIKAGDLQSVHIGRRAFIPAESLNRYVEELVAVAGKDQAAK